MFVHGFLCSHEDWRHQLKLLSKTRDVVACDLRGHGKTPGRPQECSIEHYGGDVAALVNNLELPNPILIGHSMGCRVVLEANRIAPERVAGMVLVDGSRFGTGDPAAAEAAAQAQIAHAGYAAWAEELFRQMFFQPTPATERLVARAVRQSAEIGAALWPRSARWDAGTLETALAAVRAPLLVIQTTTRDAQTRSAARSRRDRPRHGWICCEPEFPPAASKSSPTAATSRSSRHRSASTA